MEGLGGLPPRRPDQQVSQPNVATQPGSSAQVVRARLVIVSGTGAGVFVYSGTPGTGTLVASMTEASQDPFGNATEPGVTVYPTIGGDLYAIQLGNLANPYSSVAALTMSDMTSPPSMPAAFTAESNASGSVVTIQSGNGQVSATGTQISLFDSVAGAEAGGLIEMVAGLLQLMGNMTVSGTINGVALAKGTAPPVSGNPATPQTVANLYTWANAITSNVNLLRSAGIAAGIWS